MQLGAGPLLSFALLLGLDRERDGAGGIDRGDGAGRGLGIQRQHRLEVDIADLGVLAEDSAGRGQRHLAVDGAGKRGGLVDLIVGQPWLRRGAELRLPHVALRLLGQAHVRTQQRMGRDRAPALRR